jgi:hypothetical protein
MAQNVHLQLFRNTTTLYADRAHAITAITALTGIQDGTPVLGRYGDGTSAVKSVLGVYHAATNITPAGWTFIDMTTDGNASGVAEAIANLVADKVGGVGQFIQSVEEKNGIVYASAATLNAAAVANTASAPVTATTVQGAIDEVAASADTLSKVIGTGATTANTVTSQLTALSAATKAATVASADKSITVTTSANGTDLAVKVDNDTIINAAAGLKTNITLTYDSTGKTIKLKSAGGTELGSIDTKDFVVDGFLSGVTYDSTANTITFTWNGDAKTTATTIPLSAIADVYTASNGVEITGLDVHGKVDPTSETYFTVSAAGFKLSGIADAIAAAKTAAKTVVAKDAAATHLTITPTTSETSGTTYTIGESDIASAADLTKLHTAAGVAANATEPDYTVTNYLTGATTLVAADKALDTQVKALADAQTAEKDIQTITLTGNVTGTVTAAANDDAVSLAATVSTDNTVLTGYAAGTDKSPVAAADSINAAFGKVENQVSDLSGAALTSVVGSSTISATTKTNNSQTLSVIVDNTKGVTWGTDNGLTISTFDAGTY